MTSSLLGARQESLESLKARLDDPQVAAALGNLLDHADLLAVLLVGLDGLVGRTETIGDSLAGGVGEIREFAASFPRPEGVSGTGVVSSLLAMSAVLPKIAGPVARIAESGVIDRMLESGLIDTVVQHAELLDILLVGLDGLVRRGETITDSLADGVGEMRGLTDSWPRPAGVSGGEIISSLLALSALLPAVTGTITRVVESRLLDRLLDTGVVDHVLASGMLAPTTMDQLAMVGRALSAASADPGDPQDVPGLLGLLKLRKDPQVGRALAFAISMLRSLGSELEAASEGPDPDY